MERMPSIDHIDDAEFYRLALINFALPRADAIMMPLL
jgi:hypothetical protein